MPDPRQIAAIKVDRRQVQAVGAIFVAVVVARVIEPRDDVTPRFGGLRRCGEARLARLKSTAFFMWGLRASV